MYKKILIGIDNSDDSMRAVEKAIEIQRNENSEIVVFHSVVHHFSEFLSNMETTGGLYNTTANYSDSGLISFQIRKSVIDEGKRLLKEVEEIFDKVGAEVETRLIFDIEPQYYIKKQVKEEEFDLVILGCKGHHSKLRRTFLGTIPEYVINNTDKDVLIIK
ncbi:MAG: universal stress protein [Promethearchaeota archaeon]